MTDVPESAFAGDPARELYDRLKPRQEAQGYFFNGDETLTLELLGGLLTNRARYGYTCCPCRLAAGEREADRDIICPCDYRAQDVEEYGACYCGLYMSQQYRKSGQPAPAVPERRPPEKLPF
jgi:ferredoxin-thioredoxin reductase catalytic chain